MAVRLRLGLSGVRGVVALHVRLWP
jgi:hypothetical protein